MKLPGSFANWSARRLMTESRSAAIGMAVLMIGAISMHIKVKDSLKKTLPSLTLLVLSLLVAILSG